MILSSECSAVRAPWYCISKPTICPAGASARADSMLAAISAPIVSSPWVIRYTPITIIDTDTSCISEPVVYVAPEDNPRIFTLVLARNTLARSHFDWITLSAPCDLMVSMADRLSISVALRCALAR